jgi:hypothetical protein
MVNRPFQSLTNIQVISTKVTHSAQQVALSKGACALGALAPFA